ncbi:N-acetyltransferase domain-containing protein [Mycena sanguinolenta]|uniref:N-acetyltransferase domain-containing protein n=1 Tax=Mycena sanguinolenta TaxID=230812 RepID=A0A8H6YAG6_9AGAR|nr:N-acetyltransferase domain-containing protein [Mycena sanguinolenta]
MAKDPERFSNHKMVSQYTYSTHALPSPGTSTSPPPDLASIARRYADLRLEALLTSPTAFASSHEIESKLASEAWAERVWRNDAVVLVCVAHLATESNQSHGLLDGEWVGSAILRGPMPGHEYALRPDHDAPPFGSDEEETKWQMTAVFASAAHRGHGIGKKLIQAGKDFAMAQTSNPSSGLVLRPAKVRLRVLIHPDNLVVLALYSATGFTDVARTTGQEAYRTNGDLALWDLKLQSLTDDMKVYWKTAKVAVVMEWLGEIP